MNRRQALLAATGLLAATRHQKAQTSSVTFDDISIDPSISGGYQQAMSTLILEGQAQAINTDTVSSAVDWSYIWATAAVSSGLCERIDAMLDPSDPNNLANAVAPIVFVLTLQQAAEQAGIVLSTDQINQILKSDFPTASEINQGYFGGSANALDYMAGGVVSALYPADATSSLAQVRRKAALNFRIPSRGNIRGIKPHIGPPNQPNTGACTGANYVGKLLSTIALGLGFAAFVFECPICTALAWSTAQPIIVANIYTLVNCQN